MILACNNHELGFLWCKGESLTYSLIKSCLSTDIPYIKTKRDVNFFIVTVITCKITKLTSYGRCSMTLPCGPFTITFKMRSLYLSHFVGRIYHPARDVLAWTLAARAKNTQKLLQLCKTTKKLYSLLSGKLFHDEII